MSDDVKDDVEDERPEEVEAAESELVEELGRPLDAEYEAYDDFENDVLAEELDAGTGATT